MIQIQKDLLDAAVTVEDRNALLWLKMRRNNMRVSHVEQFWFEVLFCFYIVRGQKVYSFAFHSNRETFFFFFTSLPFVFFRK